MMERATEARITNVQIAEPLQIAELKIGEIEMGELQAAAEGWSPQRIFEWACQTFGDRVAIASAFGAEGVALIDMASRVCERIRVFTLDTEFLFPETYALMDQVEQKYGITIERVHSLLSAERQAQAHGPELWKRNPDQCCNLRKVEPLRRKLAELRAWVTSIRRDQTPDRAGAGKIEWDAKFGLVKINPIADWSSEQVWQYIRKHGAPYNALHELSYPSIGCTHCTRPVQPGEDPRAGRWAGLGKTECGLHIIQPVTSPPEADA
ncbi:MAG: phosphoadenylyl-sulfate reductase [Candidatus Sulfotelmatobacter sp.]|jgi:phosphoadenosine phosphosulfate reductase